MGIYSFFICIIVMCASPHASREQTDHDFNAMLAKRLVSTPIVFSFVSLRTRLQDQIYEGKPTTTGRIIKSVMTRNYGWGLRRGFSFFAVEQAFGLFYRPLLLTKDLNKTLPRSIILKHPLLPNAQNSLLTSCADGLLTPLARCRHMLITGPETKRLGTMLREEPTSLLRTLYSGTAPRILSRFAFYVSIEGSNQIYDAAYDCPVPEARIQRLLLTSVIASLIGVPIDGYVVGKQRYKSSHQTRFILKFRDIFRARGLHSSYAGLSLLVTQRFISGLICKSGIESMN